MLGFWLACYFSPPLNSYTMLLGLNLLHIIKILISAIKHQKLAPDPSRNACTIRFCRTPGVSTDKPNRSDAPGWVFILLKLGVNGVNFVLNQTENHGYTPPSTPGHKTG